MNSNSNLSNKEQELVNLLVKLDEASLTKGDKQKLRKRLFKMIQGRGIDINSLKKLAEAEQNNSSKRFPHISKVYSPKLKNLNRDFSTININNEKDRDHLLKVFLQIRKEPKRNQGALLKILNRAIWHLPQDKIQEIKNEANKAFAIEKNRN